MQYDNVTEVVGANYFMTYHTILRTSKDFYSSLIEARVIADSISETLSNITNSKVEVFPYSIFYVYYEQYLTMWRDVLVSLSISIAAIFVVTFILLGLDIHSAVVVLITIIMILVDLFGLMYLWDITLNAVSLVNLVMVRFSTDFYPTRFNSICFIWNRLSEFLSSSAVTSSVPLPCRLNQLVSQDPRSLSSEWEAR